MQTAIKGAKIAWINMQSDSIIMILSDCLYLKSKILTLDLRNDY